MRLRTCWCVCFAVAFSAFANGQHISPSSAIKADSLLAEARRLQWRDPNRMLSLAEQALGTSELADYNEGVVAAKNLLGFAYWTLGDNDIAIQLAMDANALAGQLGHRTLEAESFYMLARSYMDIGELSRAKAAILRAEVLAQAGPNWELLTSIYNLRGVVLFIDGKRDSALHYYHHALATGQTHRVDSVNFARIVSNIGECHLPQQPSEAMVHFNRALTLARNTGNVIAEASINDILGHAYLRTGALSQAEMYQDTALRLARQLGLRRVVRHAYAGLVDIRLQQKRGAEAVVYLRNYYQVRDSLQGTTKIRQIVELEARHALALKEQNIQLLQREAKIKSLYNNLLGLGVVFISITALGLIYWQRYRYRKNRELLNLEIDLLARQHDAALRQVKTHQAVPPGVAYESQDQKLLRKAMEVVEAHLADARFGVDQMAAEMNMSRTHLHRKVKAVTGFSPSELIRSIRLKRAATLILHRTDTVAQIAQQVGFDDYSHFSRAFKKYFGVAPTGYVAQQQQRSHPST